MQSNSFFHGEGLALPVLRAAWALLLGTAQTDEARRLAGGYSLAFFQEEVVEGPNGKDFGVPVVEGCPLGEGKFARWEAFHAGSTAVSEAVDLRIGLNLSLTPGTDM